VTSAGLGEHVAAIRDAVLSRRRVRVAGGGSKDALSAGADLSLAAVRGVREYDPQEYTFTALAGTTVEEVSALLHEHGQYLPFDPPFAAAGATLGGTVASGLSGPGRFRFGGVRDFLLGVRFVSGDGELLTGGGKVVKNAAGFDLPKLMVGSLGRFGVMVEMTFKVFPRPEAYASLALDLPNLRDAAAAMHALAAARFDLTCLELEPPGRVTLRVGGTAQALPTRLERLRAFVAQGGEVRLGEDDEALWRAAREFSWVPEGHALVKVALSPLAVVALEEALAGSGVWAPRRYGVGGNVAYLAWPDGVDLARLGAILEGLQLRALALRGRHHPALLGRRTANAFEERLARVLDPRGVFAREAEAPRAA
jgi:glycolate oxidase FAD binding subunit